MNEIKPEITLTDINSTKIFYAVPKSQVEYSPECSDWSCDLFGMGSNGINFRPRKGDEPNAFWRKMQYICFGHKWSRRSK